MKRHRGQFAGPGYWFLRLFLSKETDAEVSIRSY